MTNLISAAISRKLCSNSEGRAACTATLVKIYTAKQLACAKIGGFSSKRASDTKLHDIGSSECNS